jgi:hypothetical protein
MQPHSLGLNPDGSAPRPPLILWWVIWGSLLIGYAGIYVALGRGPVQPTPAGQHPLFGVIGMGPLFLSIVIRWLLLPRAGSYGAAFVLFIVGITMAEAGGLLGVFLGGVYRNDLALLAVLGIVQFVPVFAKGFLRPKEPGFHGPHGRR